MSHSWESSGKPYQSSPGNRIPPYDPTTREHFWIVGIAYRWTPTTTFLDQENEAMVSQPGCHHCQQFYTPALYTNPCPGTPPP